MKILIFEPSLTGHHFEFLAYLIRYANETGLSESLAVVTREEFRARYLKYFPASDLEPENYKSLRFLEADELAWLEDASVSVLKRHWRSYVFMHQIAKEVGASHIHADSFNSLQLFTLRRRDDLPTLSCIFYGPFSRMQACGGLRSRFLHNVSLIRRKLNFWAAMRSGRYKNVFLLNDEWSAKKLNSDFNVNCCKHLPDPVWSSYLCGGESSPKKTFADNAINEFNILFFGDRRPDKGSFLLLKSASLIESSANLSVVVRFHGLPGKSFKGRYKKDFDKIVDEINNLGRNIRIVVDDSLVDYREARNLFVKADLVHLVYERTDRSSGVLGCAAKFRTPVLASNTGLLADLVREYSLGFLVQAMPSMVAVAVNGIAKGEISSNEFGFDRYVGERDWRTFARIIYES